jgi:multidrug efflux system membrane fusion protein
LSPDRRTLAVSAALLSTLGLAGASCSKSQGAPPGRTGRPPLAVRVAPVAMEDLTYRIQAVGSLEAQEMVQVVAEVEGAVSEVLFNEGDRVGPQTVLLRIDPERYRLEAQRAGAAVQQASADLNRSTQDLTRREQLAQDQLVAVEELARARGEHARLTAALEAAKASHGIALQNARKAEVRAPKAGEINTKTVETGRFVKTGDVLATLVDTSRLRLRLKLTEAESMQARVGDEIRFRVASLGPRDFPARIYHVSGVADPTTRQVEVLAWVKNPGVLKPGFFAEVAIGGQTHKQALSVPEGAVQATERGFVAYVVENGTASARPLQIGLRSGTGSVEILSGLKAGETVVIEGSDRLADGMPVKPAGAQAAAKGAEKTGEKAE